MNYLDERDWDFLDKKILHKCGKLVVRPTIWYGNLPLYCSWCNIPMPGLLQDIAEHIYDESSFHDPNIFYVL